MEFAALAREIGYETNYPWRLNKDDLIDWLISQGVLLERNPAFRTAQPAPVADFLDWFEFETERSRYGKGWQRISVSERGVLEIKKLITQQLETQ